MEPRPEGVSRQRGTSGRWLQPPARLPLGRIRIRPRSPESAHDRYRPVEGLPIRQHLARRSFPRQRTARAENQSSPLTKLVHKERKGSDCPSLSTVGRLWHFCGFGVRNPTQATERLWFLPHVKAWTGRSTPTSPPKLGVLREATPQPPSERRCSPASEIGGSIANRCPPGNPPLIPDQSGKAGVVRAPTPPDRLEAPRSGRRPRCGRPVRPRSSLPAAPAAGPCRRSPSSAARRARPREHHRRDPSPQQRIERHHHADGRPVSTHPHRLPQAAAGARHRRISPTTSVPPLRHGPRPPRRGQSAGSGVGRCNLSSVESR